MVAERAKAVAERAGKLDTGEEHCLDPNHPQGADFWQQGVAAFRADVRLEACPFDPGAEQDDWLRGWMAAELIEFGQFENGPEAGAVGQ